MRKIFKYFLFTVFMFLFVGCGKNTNSISKINMDIYIDSNGTAHITETWNAYLNKGTEGYRSYRNMGDATIENLKVSDDVKEYAISDSWDTSLTFDDKAYKAGIHNISNGLELCFGISKYGNHTYRISYDMVGFVAKATDADIAYWELIPSELAEITDSVEITIYSDEPYSDNLDVWGYGNYGGLAYVKDGKIHMSNDHLKSDEYMTLLVKYEPNTFNTQHILYNSFEHYYNMAEEGAEHYVSENKSSDIVDFFAIFFNAFIWIAIILAIILGSKPKFGTKRLKFSKDKKKIPKDVNMFRDLPCGKDIKRAYWIAAQYGMVKKKTDYLGAVLLKWIKEKKVTVQNESKGTVFKKEDTKIIFNTPLLETNDDNENKLYQYMYEASKDGILENKEFEKWCSVHYSKMLDWFDKVIDSETNALVNENKIHMNGSTYEVDDSMYEEALKVAGLKQFFNEFDNMSDKEAIDVMLWEEYLMYAQIFGVAEKVAKQFKKLYPDVITDTDYNTFIYINHVSYSGINSASAARSAAESYSSGGGGFSSGGGGGGSFGGGGGGGFR